MEKTQIISLQNGTEDISTNPADIKRTAENYEQFYAQNFRRNGLIS